MFLPFLVHPDKSYSIIQTSGLPHYYITVHNSIANLSYLVFSVSLFVLTDNPLYQITVFCSADFRLIIFQKNMLPPPSGYKPNTALKMQTFNINPPI